MILALLEAGNDLETHLAVPILEISGGNYRVGTGVNDSSAHAYQNLQDSTNLLVLTLRQEMRYYWLITHLVLADKL